jgi:hypothetical protein
LISTNAGSFLKLTKTVHDADFLRAENPRVHVNATALLVAVVLPLADGINMDRVVQKGPSALKFLLQDRDPRVQVVEPEATATVLISCPTQGNPDDTTVPVTSLCNGWSRLRGF